MSSPRSKVVGEFEITSIQAQPFRITGSSRFLIDTIFDRAGFNLHVRSSCIMARARHAGLCLQKATPDLQHINTHRTIKTLRHQPVCHSAESYAMLNGCKYCILFPSKELAEWSLHQSTIQGCVTSILISSHKRRADSNPSPQYDTHMGHFIVLLPCVQTGIARKQRKPRLLLKKKLPFIHFLNNNIQNNSIILSNRT